MNLVHNLSARAPPQDQGRWTIYLCRSVPSSYLHLFALPKTRNSIGKNCEHQKENHKELSAVNSLQSDSFNLT